MMEQPTEVTPLYEYCTEPVFYVYVHKRLKDGSVFYVGKGKNKRAWSKRNRNQHWLNIVTKDGGYDIEIICSDLTELQAFELETKTIKTYGIDNLTNQTFGGVSTTGYRHTEATRELQSRIAKQRMENDHEFLTRITKQISDLTKSQSDEFRKQSLVKALETVRSYSPEEYTEYVKRKTAWLHDSEKVKQAKEKRTAIFKTEEHRRKISSILKQVWANKSEEELQQARLRSSETIQREDVRAKLLEIRSHKLIVNRRHVFDATSYFSKLIGHPNAAGTAIKNSEYPICLFKGYLIEYYNPELHKNAEVCDSLDSVRKLTVSTMPRSGSPVMDNEIVFLSWKEAADYFEHKKTATTQEWISKCCRANKSAFGHSWRLATQEEIIAEVLKRVELLYE